MLLCTQVKRFSSIQSCVAQCLACGKLNMVNVSARGQSDTSKNILNANLPRILIVSFFSPRCLNFNHRGIMSEISIQIHFHRRPRDAPMQFQTRRVQGRSNVLQAYSVSALHSWAQYSVTTSAVNIKCYYCGEYFIYSVIFTGTPRLQLQWWMHTAWLF